MSGQEASALASRELLSQHARRLAAGQQRLWSQSPCDIADGRVVWRLSSARSASLPAGASAAFFWSRRHQRVWRPVSVAVAYTGALRSAARQLLPRAHGVVVSHPPRMRKALSSIPSVPTASTQENVSAQSVGKPSTPLSHHSLHHPPPIWPPATTRSFPPAPAPPSAKRPSTRRFAGHACFAARSTPASTPPISPPSRPKPGPTTLATQAAPAPHTRRRRHQPPHSSPPSSTVRPSVESHEYIFHID